MTGGTSIVCCINDWVYIVIIIIEKLSIDYNFYEIYQGCGVGVVGSRRFLDGVGLGLLRILGVRV